MFNIIMSSLLFLLFLVIVILGPILTQHLYEKDKLKDM